MSNNKRQHASDIISLIYTRRASILYGCVRFFRPLANGKRVNLVRQSSPFVISQSIGQKETVVVGSVYELIREIRRLIQDRHECDREFNSSLRHSGVKTSETLDTSKKAILVSVPEGDKADELYFNYVREITKILLLLASQTRNLIQIFPRFNTRRVSLFDYEGNGAGTITLKELFDYFVHNRYLYVDAEYVVDLFSDKIPKHSTIFGKFMGYKINWREILKAIQNVTNEVKIRDLTGMLRGRLEKLSSASPHKDIIYLIQNLESFSNLLATKIPDKRYRFMLDLIFNDVTDRMFAESWKNAGRRAEVRTQFESPHVKIHEKLSEKRFTIQVRCKITMSEISEQPEAIRILNNHRINVGYQQFFDHVNQAFGDDSLMGSV